MGPHNLHRAFYVPPGTETPWRLHFPNRSVAFLTMAFSVWIAVITFASGSSPALPCCCSKAVLPSAGSRASSNLRRLGATDSLSAVYKTQPIFASRLLQRVGSSPGMARLPLRLYFRHCRLGHLRCWRSGRYRFPDTDPVRHAPPDAPFYPEWPAASDAPGTLRPWPLQVPMALRVLANAQAASARQQSRLDAVFEQTGTTGQDKLEVSFADSY